MNYGPVIFLETNKYEHAPCINESRFRYRLNSTKTVAAKRMRKYNN
jgi:hypothetical protein